MSVYQQTLHFYDRGLEHEREVAKATVEFFTEKLDPNLPPNWNFSDDDKGDDESSGDGSDSEDDSETSAEPAKTGCVIFDFYRVSFQNKTIEKYIF